MRDCFSPIDEFVKDNPRKMDCLWYSFIVMLLAFLVAGLTLFLPDQKSILGATLLLIGAIGLMFVLVLYAIHCVLSCKPLLP